MAEIPRDTVPFGGGWPEGWRQLAGGIFIGPARNRTNLVRWLRFLRHYRAHTRLPDPEEAWSGPDVAWRLERLNLRIGHWKLLDWIDTGGEFCGFVWYDGWHGWYLRRDDVDGYWTDCTLFVAPLPHLVFARSWSWAWRYEERPPRPTLIQRAFRRLARKVNP